MSFKIQRTYPQPDSPAPHIGPRERALAVFKYLLDIEPEDARKHKDYPLLLAAFEQAERVGARKWAEEFTVGYIGPWPELKPSLVPELSSEKTCDGEIKPFGQQP